MIVALCLLLWTFLFIAISWVSWIKIHGQAKVYLLILYNAVFLSGIFWFFPLLKGIH